MARRKNRPEAVQEKFALATRLREVRIELFGERGGSEMARRLGIPVRTWYNYESGVTVPAEALLRFLELTGVEPSWLLHGRGERYRAASTEQALKRNVRELLHSALDQLAHRGGTEAALARPDAPHARAESAPSAAVPPGPAPGAPVHLPKYSTGAIEPSARPMGRAGHSLERVEAIPSQGQPPCVRVDGDAMAPLLADGAIVGYSEAAEDPRTLANSLVVAWIEGRPIVRWLELAGRYGVLRAENPSVAP